MNTTWIWKYSCCIIIGHCFFLWMGIFLCRIIECKNKSWFLDITNNFQSTTMTVCCIHGFLFFLFHIKTIDWTTKNKKYQYLFEIIYIQILNVSNWEWFVID